MKSGNGFSLEDIESVVFSGGGVRCLWQAGVWSVLSQQPGFNPTTIAAASAGATMACLLITNKVNEGLQHFKEVTTANKKNAYWKNLFSKERVFPHFSIYRKAIFELINEHDLETLHRGPEFRVLISQPPCWLGAKSGAIVGMFAYALEKSLFYPMHPVFSKKLGYKPLIVKMSECHSVEELAELLMQSSCTPPFVPVLKRNGKPALDGGLIDNVPVDSVADKSGWKLVLLSRKYPDNRVPKTSDRIYFQPSQPVTISKWDYTDPNGLQFAYDLGRKDAVKLIKSF